MKLAWIKITKKNPPPFEKQLLLVAGKEAKVGYLREINEDGLLFVDKEDNSLSFAGNMVNPYGDDFQPTKYIVIEL